MQKIFLIFIILLSSCGYQPLYSNKNAKEFTFKEIEFVTSNDASDQVWNDALDQVLVNQSQSSSLKERAKRDKAAAQSNFDDYDK